MNKIATLVRKEVLDILRDKKTLIMMSLWSPFMESGPETVLHTTFITMG